MNFYRYLIMRGCLYGKRAKAAEPRVKKVFTALSEIEADHIALEERLLKGR